MKLIGIDYGVRRIGMAATDEHGEFIRSLPTIDRKKNPEPVSAVCAVIAAVNPTDIVIGVPLNPLDSDTAMSFRIRSFAEKLKNKTSLPIHFIDESWTSRQATDIIRMRKKKHRRAKGNVDRIAACLILEAFQKEKQ